MDKTAERILHVQVYIHHKALQMYLHNIGPTNLIKLYDIMCSI